MLLAGKPGQLTSCLKTSPPFDWDRTPAQCLRLYRWIDGDETLDEVLIHRYPLTGARWAVEISTHGGPRIVQRLLMHLRRNGAEMVHPATLIQASWPRATGLQAEALALLPRARTRRMAAWLTSNASRLADEIERIHCLIEKGRYDSSVQALRKLLDRGTPGLRALNGIRVVLIGEPNAGKSTLANALAEHDRAIVSPTPGTTRDWTEHPAAIEGIPFTVVDTAGLRDTQDAIERLAIQRAHDQSASADLVIRVIDATAPPTPTEIKSVGRRAGGSRSHPGLPTADLFVWNKCEQSIHPGQLSLQRDLRHGSACISARSSTGLDELLSMIIETSGYRAWSGHNPELFSSRQIRLFRLVLSQFGSKDPATAALTLADLREFPPEDT